MNQLKPHIKKLTPELRLYELKVPLIGLTGGIGSGKSTVAQMLKKRGLPLICADELVKQIYLHPNTIEFIQRLCPEVISKDKQINFTKLRQLAFSAPGLLSQIEDFIYQRLPLAFEQSQTRLNNPNYLIYDVPLLFEKELENKFDQTVLVYCPPSLQKQRVIQRDSTDEKTIESILNKQLPIDKKKEMSDYVIDNTGSLTDLEEEVSSFLASLLV